MVEHAFYLEICLKEAWKHQLETLPNPSVSALILDKFGAIIALESHKESGTPHAEVKALQSAYAKLSGDLSILKLQDSSLIHNFLLQNAKDIFKDCTIYTSLEPCGSAKVGRTPSCATLLKELKPKCVVIGAMDSSKGAKGGAEELANSGILVIKSCEVESLRALNEKFNELLLPFDALQKRGKFILFKYASRLDGSINGGQISSKVAQRQMHNFRAKADFLLISGRSVRLDSPTLDTRFATLGGKNPNILILTKQKDFPQNAPLFKIPNRSVEFLHSLESLQNYNGFIFCEGGSRLFSEICDKIDMLLLILNPSFSEDSTLTMQLNKNFKILHTRQVGDDLFIFAKNIEY